MNYYLDTNIFIYFLKGLFPSITENLKSLRPQKVKVAAIVKTELLLGAQKSRKPKQNRERVLNLLDPYEVIPFGNEESFQYSEIRAELEKRGQIIGPNDLILASIVSTHNGILITNNTKEFRRIPNLRIENWIN